MTNETLVWVCIMDLWMEYYVKSILLAIALATANGILIKVELQTLDAVRGNYVKSMCENMIVFQ